ncbi:hypothetical protein [Streptomyces sp. SID3212]|uniref:hypothetical protein n=1 Tax=Streptomyces sp. SID3212 TaxID=2690259 RepID=UPI00136E3720|nr:hypothetical protein [Streptomyces sp. SID3212]MYV52507.1 hypothetical protein [Streptomyces sp. SID3212]
MSPLPVAPLRGDEPITGLSDTSVVDFWRFAMPDLKVNNTRGVFAEFLVHQAVGSTRRRVEWASHDVETNDGLRVEVKAGAYLQAWEQHRHSDIRFTGLRARTWSPTTGYSNEKSYNAHVYVFAVQTAREHADYDPLDTAQWEFYVLPRPKLERLNTNSLSLASVRAAAGQPAHFPDLGSHIRTADPRPPAHAVETTGTT